MNFKAIWITRTAMLTALLVVMQAATASLGNTLITGSIVNLILVISVVLCGLASGITVAVISPILAKLIGIGPFWVLIPFIIAGNIVLILIWHYIGGGNFVKGFIPYIAAIVIAASCKFLTLFIGVAKIAVPFILKLPEPQASVISNVFSIPQLFTALIGGTLAALILPTLKNVVKT